MSRAVCGNCGCQVNGPDIPRERVGVCPRCGATILLLPGSSPGSPRPTGGTPPVTRVKSVPASKQPPIVPSRLRRTEVNLDGGGNRSAPRSSVVTVAVVLAALVLLTATLATTVILVWPDRGRDSRAAEATAAPAVTPVPLPEPAVISPVPRDEPRPASAPPPRPGDDRKDAFEENPVPKPEPTDPGKGSAATDTPAPPKAPPSELKTPVSPPPQPAAPPAADVAAGSEPPLPAATWLTEPEREFFAALGLDARIGDKALRRTSDLSRLPAIAARAPQPLRGRIETIARSFERMKVTAEEKAKFGALLTGGQAVVQQQMAGAILGTLLGQNPTEAATDAVNNTLKQGKVSEAWKLQREWLERALAARDDADTSLAAVTDDLRQRAGKSRPAADLALRVEVTGTRLSVVGRVGSQPIGQPVLQVTLYRKSTGGQWTGLNLAGAALGQALGLKDMDTLEGTQLALAQERVMNLPLVTTVLLPTLEPGSRVNVSLGLAVKGIGVTRAEARLWSAEGSFKVGELAGLHDTRLPLPGGGLTLPGFAPFGHNPLGGLLPGSAERFVKGSVWQGTQTQTRPRPSTARVELVVLDRDGDRFKADLRRGGQHVRTVEGTIKDGEIHWQAAAGEASKGFPHVGVINDKQLKVTYSGAGTTGAAEGSLSLQCVSPDPK